MEEKVNAPVVNKIKVSLFEDVREEEEEVKEEE